MTDVSRAAPATSSTTQDSDYVREVTGWAGWVTFGGVMMILLGVFEAIQGLVALFNSDYYLVGTSGLALSFDFTAWGWLHLVIGVVSIGAGFGLLAGNMAARVIAVVFAMLSAIANVTFIAAYPFWSLSIIVVDVLVIYAIVAHGRELKA